ncbi:ABC transporter ATP-binding protein [Mesomycoplasma conjunctivae]|uniref:Multidrug resistance protein homolog n=1 Tax=Mesomycoplasma conjunctivae (strain ATCC 25834 / NCTC 10147 / HRC/581) TaxID=572263 RepID=C5J648_MESCH|nr:ABC transporter ATP-binding protein [Mesomycoplasma conjunctivae]CAT04940.1 Multidrug resistance protein homolog [Mesomycoplasma conjunctivae]VEU66085.1 ABC transporter ATP-binding protein [Mesomycoplasma conjunctivae]
MKKITKLYLINAFFVIVTLAFTYFGFFAPKLLYEAILANKIKETIIWVVVQIFFILFEALLGTFYASFFNFIFGQTKALGLLHKRLNMFDNQKDMYKTFAQKDSGSTFSKIYNETFNKGQEYFIFFLDIISSILPLFTMMFTIFYIQPIIGAVVLVLTLIWTLFPTVFKKKIESKVANQLKSYENLNDKTTSILSKFEGLLFFNKINLLPKILNTEVKKASIYSRKYNFWLGFSSGINFGLTILFTFISNVFIVILSIVLKQNISATAILISINTASNLFLSRYSETISSVLYFLSLKKQLKVAPLKIEQKESAFDEELQQITISNLSFQYQDKKIFDNINLNFIQGKKYLLRGENGSGKSTLMKILMGFERDYEGEIKFNNTNAKDILQLDIIKKISYVDGKPLLIEGNIYDNIAFFKNVDRKTIDELIMISGLQKYKDSVSEVSHLEDNDFSTGEKQRINFASHIVENKPFVVIDEGLSNVDQANTANIITWLLQKNITLILISHNLDEQIAKQFDYIIDIDKLNKV